MNLLTITRLHNKAAVVRKCLLNLFAWVYNFNSLTAAAGTSIIMLISYAAVAYLA